MSFHTWASSAAASRSDPRRNFAPRGVTSQGLRDALAILGVSLQTENSAASKLGMFKIDCHTISLWGSGSAVKTLTAAMRVLKLPCVGGEFQLIAMISNAFALGEKDTRSQDSELAANGPIAPVAENNQLPGGRNPKRGVIQNSRNNDTVNDHVDIAHDRGKDHASPNLISAPAGEFISSPNTFPAIPEKVTMHARSKNGRPRWVHLFQKTSSVCR